MGGYHAANEEAPEAKATGMRRTVIERRRVIVVAGKRRIRGNRSARSGYADAEHHSEQRNHFRRRGNRRCQLGDVLCLRQGECRNIRAGRATSPWRLRRLRRLWRLLVVVVRRLQMGLLKLISSPVSR